MIRVLLVECNPVLSKSYEIALKNHFKSGISIEIVATGLVAIDCLKSQQVYDVVIVDLDLPMIDGIEVSQKIRKLGFQGMIVAHTKFGIREAKKAILDGIINGFAIKNNKENLLSVVRYKMRANAKQAG